jgi:hypothetical protein
VRGNHDRFGRGCGRGVLRLLALGLPNTAVDGCRVPTTGKRTSSVSYQGRAPPRLDAKKIGLTLRRHAYPSTGRSGALGGFRDTTSAAHPPPAGAGRYRHRMTRARMHVADPMVSAPTSPSCPSGLQARPHTGSTRGG